MPFKPFVKHKAVISFLKEINKTDEQNGINNNIDKVLREIYPTDFDLEALDAKLLLIRKYINKYKNKGRDEKFKAIYDIYKDISYQLFNNYNGRIVLKSDELIIYNLYYTSLDTYPFYAIRLLNNAKSIQSDEHKLKYLLQFSDESFYFDSNLEEKIDKISDMHIHLGTSLDFHYRISYILNNPKDIYQYLKDIPEIFVSKSISKNFIKNIFTLTHILETLIVQFYLKKDVDGLLDKIDYMLQNTQLDYDFEEFNDIDSIRKNSFLLDYIDNMDDYIDQKLLTEAILSFNKDDFRYDLKKGDKLLLLFILNNFIKEKDNLKENLGIYKAIDSYLTLRHFIKGIIFQQHLRSGYTYFSEFTQNLIRKKTKGSFSDIFKSCFNPRLHTNIEFRTTIPNSSQDLKKFFFNLYKEFMPFKDSNDTKIIFHFIKKTIETIKKEM